MTTIRRPLFILAALAGTSISSFAFAQASDANDNAVKAGDQPASADEIVVTGSRIDRAGFDTPTPVRALSGEELGIGSRSNIGQVLNDQPQFIASVSQTTTSQSIIAGSIRPDLRGLGAVRTLTLVDGRRFAADSDISLLPSSLVGRVDIVTGGASAAWGAGAVAGVVNLSLNTKLHGLVLAGSAGISDLGGAEQRLNGAFGMDFAGGRGHVLLGAEYVNTAAGAPRDELPAAHLYDLISNPNYTAANGQGAYLLAEVRYSNRAVGGLINNGPLAGQTFNPDGTLRPFQYGVVRGALMIGGEGPWENDGIPLTPPSQRWSAMGRVSYDLTDDIAITADLLHGESRSDYGNYLPESQIYTISVDNAFLPAAVRSTLVAAGTKTFTLGRYNTDFAFIHLDSKRVSNVATLAAKGSLGDRFRWDAYYSHSTLNFDLNTSNRTLTQNLSNSVDSVISPTTGLPICRIALTSPTTNCVPINLFGQGAPSAAAKAYVTGTNGRYLDQRLDVAAATLRGEPFDLWAGPVSIAAGVEWRRDALDVKVSAADLASSFRVQNYTPLSGRVTVKEAFGEVLVPIARDLPLLRALDVNAAIRASDYSTSGSITSWKAGVTDELIPGLRFRGSWSKDIRAPGLDELYLLRATFVGSVVADPVKGTSSIITVVRGGNTDLKPERSTTKTAGFVLTPAGLPGLSLSADYFDIDIKGVIATLSAQALVNACAGGQATACGAVQRDAAGNLVQVSATLNNVSRRTTSGVDFDLAYRRRVDALNGSLYTRTAVTWTRKLEIAGADIRGSVFENGSPEWRGTATVGFDGDVLGGYARLRYVGAGIFNRSVDIENNHVSPRGYLDLGTSAKVPSDGREIELSLSVNNVTNRGPANGSWFTSFYDLLGRYFTAGAKVRF